MLKVLEVGAQCNIQRAASACVQTFFVELDADSSQSRVSATRERYPRVVGENSVTKHLGVLALI
jgi:hypothetical protein